MKSARTYQVHCRNSRAIDFPSLSLSFLLLFLLTLHSITAPLDHLVTLISTTTQVGDTTRLPRPRPQANPKPGKPPLDMGLPDRTGDPGDSEFARPTIPSSIPNGSTPGSSEKYGTDRDFPFVDHVACFLWSVFLSS